MNLDLTPAEVRVLSAVLAAWNEKVTLRLSENPDDPMRKGEAETVAGLVAKVRRLERGLRFAWDEGDLELANEADQ